MIRQILVPLDGSATAEGVLPLAQLLAQRLNGALALLYVVDTQQLGGSEGRRQQPALQESLRREHNEGLAYLQRVQESLAPQGVPCTADVLPGTPAEAIVFLAHTHGVDLIMMSTRSRLAAGPWPLGSVADKLLETAECPVLLCPPQPDGSSAPGGLSSVIVPLDGSPRAEAALPLAEALARSLWVPLYLLRVLPDPPFRFIEHRDPPEPVAGSKAVDLLHSGATTYLEGTARRLRAQGVTLQTRLLRGDPEHRILELAAGLPHSIVVMTSHGTTGIGRYSLGSVTKKVVAASTNPVVVVRPVL